MSDFLTDAAEVIGHRHRVTPLDVGWKVEFVDIPMVKVHKMQGFAQLRMRSGAPFPGRVKSTRSFWHKTRAAGFMAVVHALPFTLLYTGSKPRDWLLFSVFYFLNIFAL